LSGGLGNDCCNPARLLKNPIPAEMVEIRVMGNTLELEKITK